MARFDLGKREAIAPSNQRQRSKPSKLWILGAVALVAAVGYMAVKNEEAEANEAYEEAIDEAA